MMSHPGPLLFMLLPELPTASHPLNFLSFPTYCTVGLLLLKSNFKAEFCFFLSIPSQADETNVCTISFFKM